MSDVKLRQHLVYFISAHSWVDWSHRQGLVKCLDLLLDEVGLVVCLPVVLLIHLEENTIRGRQVACCEGEHWDVASHCGALGRLHHLLSSEAKSCLRVGAILDTQFL